MIPAIPDTRPADLSLPCSHPFVGCPCRQAGDAEGPVVATPTPQGSFQLGFKRWHDLEPELIGDPLKDEQNVAPAWQIQPTTEGILSWTYGKGHAFVRHDGAVWRWDEDWPASRRVG